MEYFALRVCQDRTAEDFVNKDHSLDKVQTLDVVITEEPLAAVVNLQDRTREFSVVRIAQGLVTHRIDAHHSKTHQPPRRKGEQHASIKITIRPKIMMYMFIHI